MVVVGTVRVEVNHRGHLVGQTEAASERQVVNEAVVTTVKQAQAGVDAWLGHEVSAVAAALGLVEEEVGQSHTGLHLCLHRAEGEGGAVAEKC